MTALALSRRRASLPPASGDRARVAMSRRGSGGRGGMRRGGGGFLPYNPTASPKLIETWLSYAGTTDDGGGLISAWQGQKAGKIFTAATTNRPTLTASQFGTNLGLVFDGSSDAMTCTTLGALVAGKTSLTVIAVCFDTAVALSVMLESSAAAASNAGAIAIIPNNVNANAIYALASGNVGKSDAVTGSGAAPLTNPGVLAATFDFTLATNETSISLDNVPIAVTRANNSNNTAAFSDQPFYLGGRTASSFWWAGTLGALAFYRGLTAAEMTTECRGLGALFGGIVVA